MRFQTVLPAAFAVSIAAQGSGDSTMNLATLVASEPQLSTLAGLLAAFPDVAELLSTQEDATLFAPTDEAFAAILARGGIFSIDQAEADSGLIEAILRYHTLRGAVPSSAVTETPQFLPTLLNYTVLVMDGDVTGANVTGGQVIEAQLQGENVVLTSGLKTPCNVVKADIKYNNGVVHIIDRLLTIPMSVSGTAPTANLTALAGAATEADLVLTLDHATDITLFAPSNVAFQAIEAATQNLSIEDLTSILAYHVVPGAVVYSTDIAAGSFATLEGGNLTITIDDDGAVFVNQARIINTDILITGGVMHVIDSVLLPSMPDAKPMPAAPVTATEVPFTSGVPTATSIYTQLAATTSNVAAGLVTSAAKSNGTASSTAPSVPEYTGGAAGKGLDAIAYAVLAGGAAVLAYV